MFAKKVDPNIWIANGRIRMNIYTSCIYHVYSSEQVLHIDDGPCAEGWVDRAVRVSHPVFVLRARKQSLSLFELSCIFVPSLSWQMSGLQFFAVSTQQTFFASPHLCEPALPRLAGVEGSRCSCRAALCCGGAGAVVAYTPAAAVEDEQPLVLVRTDPLPEVICTGKSSRQSFRSGSGCDTLSRYAAAAAAAALA